MSKVLVDRELLERAMYAKDGKELIYANRELRAILDQPAEAEGVSVVGVVCISHFKNNPAMENVEFHLAADLPQGQHEVILHSSHLAALSTVTAERDALSRWKQTAEYWYGQYRLVKHGESPAEYPTDGKLDGWHNSYHNT